MPRTYTILLILFVCTSSIAVKQAAAQQPGNSPLPSGQSAPAPTMAPSEDHGMILIETYEASNNREGLASDLDSTIGWQFNKYFSWDVGEPIYLLHSAGSAPFTVSGAVASDPYTDLLFSFENSAISYDPSVHVTFPVVTTDRGVSTGRVTWDWNNHFEHPIHSFAVDADLGIANSISDTRYFVRPFSSLGYLAHFEAGGKYAPIKYLSFNLSGYDVAPWGQQKIYNRIDNPSASSSTDRTVIGGAGLTRDYGVILGGDIYATHMLDIFAGYTRSEKYGLDTFWFGVSVDFSSLLRPKHRT